MDNAFLPAFKDPPLPTNNPSQKIFKIPIADKALDMSESTNIMTMVSNFSRHGHYLKYMWYLRLVSSSYIGLDSYNSLPFPCPMPLRMIHIRSHNRLCQTSPLYSPSLKNG